MKKIFFALIVALVSLSATAAITNWRAHRYEGFKALPTTSSDILFVGNSITHMHEWWEALGGNHNVKNRGVSGARVGETLDYIDGQMMGKPGTVFLGIGVNDVYGDKNLPAAGYVERLEKVVNHILWANPQVHLVVSSVHPANRTSDVTFAQLAEMYKAVVDRKKAEGYDVSFVSTLEPLAPIQSSNSTYTFDGLHLTAYGYKLWLNELKKGGHITTNVYETISDDQMKSDIAEVGKVQGSSYGMRLSYFSQLPINANDIFVIGDEWVHSTEMHELVGSDRVKDRATGWGYPGMDLSNTAKCIPYILHGTTMPAEIWLATGASDITSSTDLETVKTRYQAVVNAIKTKSSSIKIKHLSQLPTTNASTNTNRVKVFNEWLKTTYGADNYVDLYTGLEVGGVLGSEYRYGGDNTLVGKGYIKIGEVLAPLCGGKVCMTIDELTAKEAKIAARKALTAAMDNLNVKFGTKPGEFPVAQEAAVKAALKAASEVLQKDATVAELQAAKTTVEAKLAEVRTTLNMPTASTSENEVWYTLCSSNRGNRYLMSDGTNLIGGTATEATYAKGQWKFVQRTDGSYDIVNRNDGKCLQTAGNNAVITVNTTAPTNGWTLSDCNAAGMYIIQNGACEINMTNTEVSGGYKVVNWSNGYVGNDKSDPGCQFTIVEVEGEPAVEPTAFVEGYYRIQVGDGVGYNSNHQSYKGKYFYANPHTSGNNTWAIGLTDDATLESTLVYISGTANQYKMEFNHGKADAYYAGYNCTKMTSNPGNLSFIPNTDNTQWRIVGNGSQYWMGWDLNGPSVGSTSNSSYNNCYFVITKVESGNTDPETKPEGTPGQFKIVESAGTYSNTASSSSFKDCWTSNQSTPQIKINVKDFAAANNMITNAAHAGDGIVCYSGSQRGGYKCTMTVSTSTPGYKITGYSFKVSNLETGYELVVGDGTTSVTTNATPQEISKEGLSGTSFDLTIDGSSNNYNKPALFTDFYVYYEKEGGNTDPEGEGDEYIIDSEHGSFTSSNANKTWHSVWTSTKTPAVQLNSGANNMTYSGKNVQCETGNTNNATYTIMAPTGYVIASYSFNFAAKDGSKTVQLSMDGKNYTTSTTPQTLSAKNVGEPNVSFTLQGANGNSTILSDFTVTIEEADPDTYTEHFVVMTRTNGIDYRIPAVAKNQKGDLIFVADYRYSGKDIGMANNGKLDLNYRIKYADGTWGEVKTLAKCIESPTFTAFGDPCIVADRESNRVMVTSCCGNVSFPNGTHSNHQGWARFYSEDGGETWSKHTDISDQVFSQLDKRADGQIRCFFIGSGKITQSSRIKVGSAYRLYCAALVKIGNGSNVNYVFFSDDFGLNWKLLGDVDDCPIPTGGDEPKAEELPDGSVVISSRTSGRLFNVFHFTDVEKGTGKWGNATNSSTHNNGTFGAGCNGEIMIVPVTRAEDGKKTYLALQSIPAASSRNNVSIYYKELTDLNQYRNSGVFAPNWKKYQVSTMASGYSTMCLDKDNHVAFFFEEDYLNPGYKMVYCDLPIEKITGKKYSYSALTEAERKTYLSEGAPAYFDTQDYASEEPVASLVAAYVANPTDANYCALNAVLNEMVVPSANAQECPYASPAPVDGVFDAESKAYTMQVKGEFYITTTSMTEGAFNVNYKTAPTTADGYWVIVGSVADGYQIYNVGAGATKVLGVTGAEAAARTALYDVNNVPANVSTTFSYHANTYGGSTTGATFFIHGTDNNALNVRAPYFALWNSGNAFTDNGSRIELTKVNYDFSTVGVSSINANGRECGNQSFDIQGRRISNANMRGFYIQGGHKVIR